MSMKKLYPGICVLTLAAALVAPSAVSATEEPEKVRHARIEAELEASAAKVLEKCGAKVAVKVDWKSFSSEDIKRYAVGSFCSSPLEALPALCRGAATKAYVKKKISAVECTYGGEGKRALTIGKSGMRMVVDFKAANYDEFARQALVDKL